MPEPEYNEFQTELRYMTAADAVPKLSDDEIDLLLARHAVADADGNAPNEEGWSPTYAMRAAARMGWKWKLGHAAELTSTDLDGDRMSANQVFDHCRAMIREYSGTASPVMN